MKNLKYILLCGGVIFSQGIHANALIKGVKILGCVAVYDLYQTRPAALKLENGGWAMHADRFIERFINFTTFTDLLTRDNLKQALKVSHKTLEFIESVAGVSAMHEERTHAEVRALDQR